MKTASETRATSFDPAWLVEQYQTGVWRYLRALGCDPSQADDFTQETFLIVLQRPFEMISPAATAAYLRKVARNLFVTATRRAGRVSAVENVQELDRTWNRWVTDDSADHLLDALRECLGGLTDRARSALEQRFRDRQSRSAIADSLNITEHGAKNLMQRAKKQLRHCIESKVK